MVFHHQICFVRTHASSVALACVAAFAFVSSPAQGAVRNPCVGNYNIAMPGSPFAAIASADNKHVFVSVNAVTPSEQSGVAVLECAGSRYRIEHFFSMEPQPSDMALTSDGRLLVVADDAFITFVDVNAAELGQTAILGYFEDLPGDDGGAVYVRVTPDDHFAFVSEESNRSITVIDLLKARSSSFARASIVGEIPVSRSPVALGFVDGGRYLLSTSQVAAPEYGFANACKPEGSDPATSQISEPPGVIFVIDVAKAETDPAHSVVHKIPSGCHPVRMALSPDGQTAWISARASNAVFGYSVAKLIGGDPAAKIAEVAVGAAPVPIIVTADSNFVLVGNSNRFGAGPQGNQTISVIVARGSASGGHEILSQIEAGRFPREFSQTADGGTIFLSNFDSKSIMVIDASTLKDTLKPQH